MKNKENIADMWLINIPTLSVSCPFSGNMISGLFPLMSEFVKDKCHNPKNTKWSLWVYPDCDKESCPIKVEI